MGIGPSEWLIIILVLVVLFGAKKIPELAKGLGQGIKEFKKAANSANVDEDEQDNKPASKS
jgi:sec-independent protein translocase protein TatA